MKKQQKIMNKVYVWIQICIFVSFKKFFLFNYLIFRKKRLEQAPCLLQASWPWQSLHRTSPRWQHCLRQWSHSCWSASLSHWFDPASQRCPGCGRLGTCSRCSGSQCLGRQCSHRSRSWRLQGSRPIQHPIYRIIQSEFITRINKQQNWSHTIFFRQNFQFKLVHKITIGPELVTKYVDVKE